MVLKEISGITHGRNHHKVLTKPTSHKPVTFTFAHAAVHSFDSAALNPLNADRRLWRMWGKLIRGNKRSNPIQRQAADVQDSISRPYFKVCGH